MIAPCFNFGYLEMWSLLEVQIYFIMAIREKIGSSSLK